MNGETKEMRCDRCDEPIPPDDAEPRTHWRAEIYPAPVMFHPLTWTFCIPCGFAVADAINDLCRANMLRRYPGTIKRDKVEETLQQEKRQRTARERVALEAAVARALQNLSDEDWDRYQREGLSAIIDRIPADVGLTQVRDD